MKRVFETSQVPHLWANQTQSEGYNSARNLYFHEKIIYSYGSHFPIASICTGANGTNAVLFTTQGYSNTTAKHKSIVRSACSQYETIYCYSPEFAYKGFHTQNIEQFEWEAENIAKSLLKAKKPEIYLSKIEQERNAALKYCEFFGLNLETFKLTWIYTASKDQFKDRLEQAEKMRREAIKKAEAQRKKAEKLRLKDFRTFKNSRVYGAEFSYLRFNPAKNRIETSQEIEIPLEIAKRTFKWLQTVLKGDGCTDCNFRVLDYEVKAVSKDLFTVGCHKIPMTEVKAIQKELNW
jgi:hypothetical protein